MKKRRKNKVVDRNGVNSAPIERVNFSTAVKMFIDEQRVKNVAFHTIRWHKENLHTLEKSLREQEMSTDPLDITEQIIKQNYILYMLDKGLKTNTINGRVRTCHAFFGFLVQEGYVTHNIAKNIGLLKGEKLIIQTFSQEQMRQMLNQPDKTTFVGYRDFCIEMLLFETGIRLSELSNIRLQDIRLNDRQIKVYGKGAKERLVPFQKTMKRVLQQYISYRGTNLDHDFLFVSVDNDPMSTRNIQERLALYGKKAGIKNIRVSPHTFRHSMAKFYILNGGDIFSLQKILGHSSLDMVRHYVELFRNEVAEQHAKFSPLERMRF